MRCVLAILALLCLSGCELMSWRTSDAESEWKSAYYSRDARFTLANGKTEYLVSPRDFGEAVCSSSACIRKSEIVSVRWYRESDPGEGLNGIGTMAGAGVTAVVLFPYTLAVVPQILSPSNTIARGPVPPLAWHSTACAPDSPSHVTQTFTTDDEAAIWLRDNRWSLGSACLRDAVDKLWNRRDQQTALELWTLSAIRERWEWGRCQYLPPAGRVTKVIPLNYDARVLPPGYSYFRLFDQLWADPRTWDYPFDLAALCRSHGGEALSPSEWPGRRILMNDAIPLPEATT